jgi:Ala-tRNA(Pro) deacylase
MEDKKIKKALNFLNKNKIKYQYLEHPAVKTVQDLKNLSIDIPGSGIKTLFLKERRGKKFYLVSIHEDKKIDLNNFAKTIKEKRLSFANEKNLEEYLQIESGSISPLALINVRAPNIKFYLDKELYDAQKVALHPNRNTATVVVEKKDFRVFLDLFSIEIIIEEF